MDSSFVPLAIALGVLGSLYLALRHHQGEQLHRERMAALDKGIDIKPILVGMAPAFGHRVYLLRGLIWLLGGAALMAALAITAPLFQDRGLSPSDQLEYKLRRARNFKDMGATEAQIAAMETEIARSERHRPPPPQLYVIGLIPMAAGVAYLLFFAIEEKRVRGLPPA